LAAAIWVAIEVRAEINRAAILQEVNQAVDDGHYDSAIQHLDELLAEDPGDQETSLLRDSVLRKRTLTVLQKESRQAAEDLEWDTAIDRLESIRKLDIGFNQPSLNQDLCEAYKQKGLSLVSQFARSGSQSDLSEAATIFAQGISVCPEDEILWSENHLAGAYLEGLKSLNRHDWDFAISNFQSVLTTRRDYAGGRANEMLYQTYLSKGDSLYQQGELNKAIVEYINALDVPVNDHSEAQERRKQVLEENLCASYLDTGLSLIDEYVQDGSLTHLSDALEEFERGLQVCPEDPALTTERDLVSLYLKGKEHYAAQNWREAIVELTQVYESDRDYLEGQATQELYRAYLNRGDQKYEEGDYNGALAEYQEALQLSVSNRSEAEIAMDRAKEALTTPPLTPIPTLEPQVDYQHPAPQLIGPDDGFKHLGEESLPVLQWHGVGDLAYNEYYEVTVSRTWQGDAQHSTVEWTEETSFVFDQFDTSDDGVYRWWVTVKRLTDVGPDDIKEGEATSPPSEQRSFLWE
jgi:tetratricopeptide (TPR) repeat protein